MHSQYRDRNIINSEGNQYHHPFIIRILTVKMYRSNWQSQMQQGQFTVWKISRQQLMHTETITRLPSDRLIVWWSVGTGQVAPSKLLTYCMLNTLILQWMRLQDMTMWWGSSVRQSRQLTRNISSHTTCSLRSAATAHSRYSELTLTLDLKVNACRDHWHAEILP